MDNSSVRVSVITCTYNRKHTLFNVFSSLCHQDYRDFEWIIADDGSTDGTETQVREWQKESTFPIVYFFQKNNGKHIASNEAVLRAKGEYIVNIDSDDIMKPDAISTFIHYWENIPKEEYEKYMSVKARCYDPSNGAPIGKEIPHSPLSCSFLDAKYKYKINAEMWSMMRTKVLREYPNPDIRGGRMNGGLRFYPEGIWQDLASRKYNTLFVNDALRGYSTDSSSSLMGRGKKYDRSPENIHLWSHVLNDNFDYFKYDPKSFIKAAVGVSMDGFFLKRTIAEILGIIHSPLQKILVFLLLPAGYLCYCIRK